MKRNEAIVLGWINKGKAADCGETFKNQVLIQQLEKLGVKCWQMDFKHWRWHPWIFLQLIWAMIVHKHTPLILSTSACNVYPMMKLMYRMKWKQPTIHWVIGGSLGDLVKNGTYNSDVIGYMNWTIVESPIMQQQLKSEGIEGVLQLPNFKPISYYPNISQRIATLGKRPLKFVFLSRIMAEKGCDYIMECARQLNDMGYENNYSITFYGKVADTYEKVFYKKLDTLNNVDYKGFLNLREKEGYDTLAQYDLMLFPTYWKGEGFAGIFIDSFISGVPILASDFAHNKQFLKENETTLFVPVHNIPSLRDRMKECIEGKYALGTMARTCQTHAETYNVDKVITPELLRKIGLMS